jgi:hypothetical protein
VTVTAAFASGRTSGIPPQLIVEELFKGTAGEAPPDYKFWCF